MAQGKKSFIIYTDSRGMVNKLSNERAGILFKTIFSYCDDENPTCEDEVVDMAFEHFKNILKRDLKKYEGIINRNRENGKKGGRPQAQNNPVGFLETQNNQSEPKKADNDNVNVNVINNNTPAKADDIFDFSKYLETLNQKFSRSFKVVNEKTKKQIKARLKEKYTKQDIIDAINNCVVSEFHKGNGYQYCTPEFFSRADILDRWSDITKPKQSKVNIEL